MNELPELTRREGTAERELATARAAFAAARPSAIDRAFALFEAVYARAEPVLAVAVVIIDLGWARTLI